MAQSENLYQNAHLIISAIRILEHQNKVPPSVNQLCKILSFSLEFGNLICNKLKELEIIEIVEGSYDNRLFIKDHLKIEEIPKETHAPKIDEEIKKFQDSRKNITKELEEFHAKQLEKKKNLFAELEKTLKKGFDKP